MKDLTVIYRNPCELNIYTKNARTHSKKQLTALVNCITNFGFLVPILIDTDDMIMSGHARLEAAKTLKLDKIPTICVNTLPEEAKKAFIIADNKISDLAAWDEDLLTQELLTLSNTVFDVNTFGIEVDSYLEEEREENYTEPESEHAIVEQGDVIWLGDHVLVCADIACAPREVDAWTCELLITDPPYNCDYVNAHNSVIKTLKKRRSTSHKNIKNDKMTLAQRDEFLQNTVHFAAKCLTETASFYVFSHADAAAMQDLFRVFGLNGLFTPKNWLSWIKNNQTFSRLDYQSKMEMILYGWRKSHKFYGCGDLKVNALHFDREQSCDLHSTMKPVPLLINLIKNSSQKGDCVLDMFAGSGSTLIACETTGRKARCVEIEHGNCDVIIDRYLQFSDAKTFKIFRNKRFLTFNNKWECVNDN